MRGNSQLTANKKLKKRKAHRYIHRSLKPPKTLSRPLDAMIPTARALQDDRSLARSNQGTARADWGGRIDLAWRHEATD